MSKSNDYEELLSSIAAIQTHIVELQERLNELREEVDTHGEEDEVCLDEVEADKAVVDAIQGMCLNMMLETTEPQGEA